MGHLVRSSAPAMSQPRAFILALLCGAVSTKRTEAPSKQTTSASVDATGVQTRLNAGETPWTDDAADALSEADQLQSAGHWQKAVNIYEKALSLSPNPPGVPPVPRWALPATTHCLTSHATCVAAFQRYVIYNNIGWSLFHLNDWTRAEQHYRLALRATPAQPPTDHAYINLATLYKAQHRTKATIKVYRAAVSLTKQLPTWAQLGYALMQARATPHTACASSHLGAHRDAHDCASSCGTL